MHAHWCRSLLALLIIHVSACQRMNRAIEIPEASISGRVVRAEDPATPVPFARIGFGARFTLADAQGNFQLRDVPRGRYDLDFRSLGSDEPNKRTATRALLVGQGPRDRAEFVLMGSVPLTSEGELSGVVSVVNPNGGAPVTVRSLSPTAVVRIFTTSPCLSCNADDGVVRGVVSQGDALVDGAFALDAPHEPITVQAVAYVPSPDPSPRPQLVNDDVPVVLGDTIVGISNIVTVADLGAPIALLFDRIDVAADPAAVTGEVTIHFNDVVPSGTRVVVRRPADSTACDITIADEQVVTTTTEGTTMTIADVPAGLWRFIECTANSGATEPVLVTPSGVRVLLQLVGQSCGSRADVRSDCDGDGVPGLLLSELEGCAASCGAADDRCEVAGVSLDCEDDGDGLVDVSEQACYGSEFGGDRDGDGRCDSVDAYPDCQEDLRPVCEQEPPLPGCEDPAVEVIRSLVLPDGQDGLFGMTNPAVQLTASEPFGEQFAVVASDQTLAVAVLVRGEPATLLPLGWDQLIDRTIDTFSFGEGAATMVSTPVNDVAAPALLFHGEGRILVVPLSSEQQLVSVAVTARAESELAPLIGRAFAVGGTIDNELVTDIDELHPSVIDNVASLAERRRKHALIAANNNTAFVFGGEDDAGQRLASVESLTMYAGDNVPTMGEATPLRRARSDAKAVLLPDGRIVVVGWEIWDPADGSRAAGPFLLNTPRVSGHIAVAVSTGGVFVAGGSGAAAGVGELLNVVANDEGLHCSAPVQVSMPIVPREGGAAFSTQDGLVFLVGGNEDSAERLDFKRPLNEPINTPGCSRGVTSKDGSWLFLRCIDPSLLVAGVVTPARDANITDIVLLDLGTKRTICLSCADGEARGAGLVGEDVASDGTAVAFISSGNFDSVLMSPLTRDPLDAPAAYVAFAEDAVAGARFVMGACQNRGVSLPVVPGSVGMVEQSGAFYVAFGLAVDGEHRLARSQLNWELREIGRPPFTSCVSSSIAAPLSTAFPISVGINFAAPIIAFTAAFADGEIFYEPQWHQEDDQDGFRMSLISDADGCLRVHTSSDGQAAVCTAIDGTLSVMSFPTFDTQFSSTNTSPCGPESCPIAEVESRQDSTASSVSVVAYDSLVANRTNIDVVSPPPANGSLPTPIASNDVPGGSPSMNQSGTIVTTINGDTTIRTAIDDLFSGLVAP
jgi:hypothetical protein